MSANSRYGAVSRRAVLSMGTGLAGAAVLGPPDALAARLPPRPRVYLRHEWSALLPKFRADVLDRTPDRIVVHHTASPNGADLTLDAAFRLSRAIQRHHMRRNGWDDIGEQFTIGRGGHILEGRNRTMPAIAQGDHVLGAQTANHNRHTLGIETAGTFTTALPTETQIAALTRLMAWLCGVYSLDPNVAIVGHRDLNSTSCPGDRLYAYIPELRERVAWQLGNRSTTRMRARRLAVRAAPSLPGPAAPFDHGPAVGPHDLLRKSRFDHDLGTA